MESILWFFHTSGGSELLGVLWRPILVGLVLYYSAYATIFARLLWNYARWGRSDKPLDTRPLPPALAVLPTLLRAPRHLAGLQKAIRSMVENGYRGELVVCASIDDANEAPDLVRELDRWIANLTTPANVTVLVARCPVRRGKAMAIHAAVQKVMRLAGRGRLPTPAVFFNMDADSDLGDDALNRLATRLTTPGRVFGQRPMIVGANVCVPRRHYWTGWRGFFTVRGQLALQVAREYMTSISLPRNNFGLIPGNGVSGALYCTWTQLMLDGPRYAALATQLGVGDWVRWWLGRGAPSPYAADLEPRPEAMTGPGDDTWVALLAMAARWRDGRIDLSLPPTPFHALVDSVRTFFVRPIAFDPHAVVNTATPTTFRGLFKQRRRWNSSRIWGLQRLFWSMCFRWSVGAVSFLKVGLVVATHGLVLAGLLLLPLAQRPSGWLALLALLLVLQVTIRTGATTLAMLQVGGLRSQWHKLLAVPLSGPYHLVFNAVTGLVGVAQDLLLFGVNTHFAPEETLKRTGTGRVALLYRCRRAFLLAVHSVRYGGIPLGSFWFGFHETPWTPSGYAGWTDPNAAEPPVRPPQRPAQRKAPSSRRRPTRPRPERTAPRLPVPAAAARLAWSPQPPAAAASGEFRAPGH